jgi:20S proteasome subunit alpha 4
MSKYDSAITIFSPTGNLHQVEYAVKAAEQGSSTIAVRGKDCLVLGVEKKDVSKLQDSKTLKKILQLDEKIFVAFSGLQADARILANIARVECQSYRLNYSDDPTVDHVAKYISGVQQKYTQKGGVRPFGISVLIAGFDSDNKPRLFQTDPSGYCAEWRANAIGRNDKQAREILEKNYKNDLSRQDAVKLVGKALVEAAEKGSKNLEILVLTNDEEPRYLSEKEIEEVVAAVTETK